MSYRIRDKILKWKKDIATGTIETCIIPYAQTKGHTIRQILVSSNGLLTYTANYLEEIEGSETLDINGSETLKDLNFEANGDMKTVFSNASGGTLKANVVIVLRTSYKPKVTE